MKSFAADTNFAELRLKIRESYESEKAFAAAIGMNGTKLSRRFRGVTRFHAEEIRQIAALLCIPDEKIETVFFAGGTKGSESYL